ncbi:1-phosphofructokinase family hexose kinase [Ramlibacter sp.]|uniref:1-phosphofructokinase family hexose kinase n=1 Tax=Ramlibacter sp. TaxID=1917967 RepID=UPI002B712F94|nr:1-phosphofructokinase family hexose kinase [Ramlibacter sp.]HWI81122.1 1-phosphofructokinase family hexose kinase [Ramlibacter sp.]
MSRMLTVTLNPALDLFTATERVLDTHKLRCDAPQRHPGGGGINVARVVHRLGGDCAALYPAGGPTGRTLRGLLDQEQVSSHCIAIAGDTRESFTVHERASGRDWRFLLPGPALAAAEWQACWDAIVRLAAPAQWIVASGSLPPGVPADFHARLARHARERGLRLVVDTSGAALAGALAEGVYLVKPSLRELREFTGQPLATPADQLAAARALVQGGQAHLVALSLGAEGALLVTPELALQAGGVAVPVASTIGAGDSLLAGLLWALDSGVALPDALAHGIAAGAASLLAPGTALCRPADVRRLRQQVRVTRL